MYFYSIAYYCYDSTPEWHYTSEQKYSDSELKKIVEECILEIAEDVIKKKIAERGEDNVEWMNNDWQPTITRDDYELMLSESYDIEWFMSYLIETQYLDDALKKYGLNALEIQASVGYPNRNILTSRRGDIDLFLKLREKYEKFYKENPTYPWSYDESLFKVKIID